jgi:hypothetical protein
MAPGAFTSRAGSASCSAACGQMLVSERPVKGGASNATPTRLVGCILSLFAALLVGLTLAAAASADVSFIQAYGWGVLDGARQFETCAITCQAGIIGVGAGQLDGPWAVATDPSGSEAVGVTANRFGGAKDAGDIYAESIQSVAEAKYLPLQATAVGELQRASRRFGTILKQDRIITVLTAKQAAKGRNRLGKLDGIRGSLITRLERDGLITSRKDLERIIASLLANGPRARATTFAQVLEM